MILKNELHCLLKAFDMKPLKSEKSLRRRRRKVIKFPCEMFLSFPSWNVLELVTLEAWKFIRNYVPVCHTCGSSQATASTMLEPTWSCHATYRREWQGSREWKRKREVIDVTSWKSRSNCRAHSTGFKSENAWSWRKVEEIKFCESGRTLVWFNFEDKMQKCILAS